MLHSCTPPLQALPQLSATATAASASSSTVASMGTADAPAPEGSELGAAVDSKATAATPKGADAPHSITSTCTHLTDYFSAHPGSLNALHTAQTGLRQHRRSHHYQHCRQCGIQSHDRVLTCFTCQQLTLCQQHFAEHCDAQTSDCLQVGIDVQSGELYCHRCTDYVYVNYAQASGSAGSVNGADVKLKAEDTSNDAATPSANTNGSDSVTHPSKRQKLSPSPSPTAELLPSVNVQCSLRGMHNLGNTCFMSVVLQAMAHNPLVQRYFLAAKHTSANCQKKRNGLAAMQYGSTNGVNGSNTLYAPPAFSYAYNPSPSPDTALLPSPSNSSLNGAAASTHRPPDPSTLCAACDLNELINAHFVDDSTPYCPHHILYTMWSLADHLSGYAQQDAHEFFMALIDVLHHATSPSPSDVKPSLEHAEAANSLSQHTNGNTPSTAKPCNCMVHTIFAGQLRSDVICGNCQHCSTSIELMFDLALDIPFTQFAPSIYECLDQFTKTEDLSHSKNTTKFNCSKCQQSSVQATKRLSIEQLPPVLTIQFKRFEHLNNANTTKVQTVKIDTFIHFPLHSFDVTPYVSTSAAESAAGEPILYNLFAAIVHKGSLENGHYVGVMRRGSEWYRSDDRTVTRITAEDVRHSQAYILMYERQQNPCAREQ